MKSLFRSLFVFFALGLSAIAQTATPPSAPSSTPSALPANIYAVGVSFNNAASPAIAGTGLYARLVDANTGTYAFTVLDALPASVKPFTVNTNIGVGVAQKLFTIAGHPLFVPTSAGISFTGSNTGWAWNTGITARFAAKKGSAWYLMPIARVNHSSVSNGSGYQPIFGLLISR